MKNPTQITEAYLDRTVRTHIIEADEGLRCADDRITEVVVALEEPCSVAKAREYAKQSLACAKAAEGKCHDLVAELTRILSNLGDKQPTKTATTKQGKKATKKAPARKAK
jgi:hypothetical protein